jgi:hypothetical protein
MWMSPCGRRETNHREKKLHSEFLMGSNTSNTLKEYSVIRIPPKIWYCHCSIWWPGLQPGPGADQDHRGGLREGGGAPPLLTEH